MLFFAILGVNFVVIYLCDFSFCNETSVYNIHNLKLFHVNILFSYYCKNIPFSYEND